MIHRVLSHFVCQSCGSLLTHGGGIGSRNASFQATVDLRKQGMQAGLASQLRVMGLKEPAIE